MLASATALEMIWSRKLSTLLRNVELIPGGVILLENGPEFPYTAKLIAHLLFYASAFRAGKKNGIIRRWLHSMGVIAPCEEGIALFPWQPAKGKALNARQFRYGLL